jgi:hypothetical protein
LRTLDKWEYLNMNRNILWAGILGLAMGLATNRALPAADKADDADAEQKQMAKEDADQAAERDKGIKGKYQKKFLGTVYLRTPADSDLGSNVVGHFVTNDKDLKPKRNYLMMLGSDSKVLAEGLKKMNGKPTQLTGVLRVIDANGEAKYLIVDSIVENGPTPTVPERRSASGL